MTLSAKSFFASLLLALGAAASTAVNAQVRCFDGCTDIKIDYGRGKAYTSQSRQWHAAEITESTVTWRFYQAYKTFEFVFDRFNARVRQTITWHEPYTNRPAVDWMQCHEVKCSQPRY